MLQVAELAKQKPQIIASTVSPHKRAAEWLSAKIEQGKREPFTEVITLTPDIAEVLLANNPDNRNVSLNLVNLLAADIEAGNWELNGEALVIAKTGELNEGQHRCHAVIQAKKSIRTAIAFGLDRNSRFTLDTGKARRAHDMLQMQGGNCSATAAAIARGLKCHERGLDHWRGGGNSLITVKMVLQKYWDNEKQIQRAIAATKGRIFAKFGSASCGAAHVFIHKRNAAECEIFFARLEDGVGLKRGNAILALRNRIMTHNQKKDRHTPAQKCALIIRYWNAWREGQDVVGALQVPSKIPKASN